MDNSSPDNIVSTESKEDKLPNASAVCRLENKKNIKRKLTSEQNA